MPRIEVDIKRCKGCELCVVACPYKVIGMSEKFASTGYYPATTVKPEKCTGCILCALVCPDVAIEVYK
ncbi:MAG: 4Fe-4S dicluster domain-containing protein [Candidatus Zixiibacteriota bacterium]